MDNREDRENFLENRAREVFDQSVNSIDARTRSRLSVARQSAIAELEVGGGRFRASWVAALAVAGVAALAVLAWRAPGGDSNAPELASEPPAGLDALELVVAGEDLELAGNDLMFFQMLDELELELAAGDMG